MKIWVDITSAPQVLFMQPLIAEMRMRGHEILITTREFTETIGVANRCGLDHRVVGAHGGKTMVGKAVANLHRAALLAILVRSQHIALAVGSSQSQAVAAALLGLPLVAMSDYEGQPGNHITFRMARRLIVPEAMSKHGLRRYGVTEAKIVSYPGIKEQLYLSTFSPDLAFRAKLGISVNTIVVTMRPPSTVSAYHRFRNTVFDETLRYVAGHSGTIAVLLPRGAEQRSVYGTLCLSGVIIPRDIIDGPQLVYTSDLVVGAGGTMNREATVLGTPVYTQFQGQRGSVDDYLIRQGKMVRVVESVDIPSIKVCRKKPAVGEPWRQASGLVREVVDKILS